MASETLVTCAVSHPFRLWWVSDPTKMQEAELRPRSVIVVALGLMTLLPLTPAQAKSISDPDDLSYAIDFRAVSLTKPDSSKLVWRFTSWSSFSGSEMLGGSNPKLQLDTRSGSAPEYIVLDGWSPMGYYCQLQKASGAKLADGVLKRPNGKTAKCVFPSSKISRTKPIHWRALIKTSFGRDRAPNSGWVAGI